MSEGQLTPPVGGDDHVAGPDDAPVTLVEYGDFECPYCGMAYPIVHAIRRALGPRLRFVYRHFPLRESHPHAQHAAEAAEAAGAQGKFWAMHDQLFEHQDALGDAALIHYARAIGLDADRVARELEARTFEPRVRQNFRSGVKSGVNGTPTFFINGERYDGTWADERAFLHALREAAEASARAR
ncbi:MAG TPA: thioredoxin domain-containing protein [Gemmatimonadaceae bacterium]|nr:thioredoxin domain-containing protein [Gemmatimonadaceae bacterium]